MTPRVTAPVLLVGSVPGDDARDVLSLCARELGALAGFVSDGETGLRQEFIQGMALATYYGHPDLEVVQRPARGWRPQGYGDLWKFRIKPGVERLRFDRLIYASDAIRSYDEFTRLKAEGAIPTDYRFLIALPLVDTAVGGFVTSAEDYARFAAAFEEAMARELALIVESIPAEDLVIQWDCPSETLTRATLGAKPERRAAWLYEGDPVERFQSVLARLSDPLPGAALLGLHLCYGNLGQRHVIEPTDLGVVTAMTNEAARRLARPLDYVHVPIPVERDDDAYFAPLRDLSFPGGRMYLGLIHDTDSLDANLARARAARRSLAEFGVSTECGFGRRPASTIPALLGLHRQLALRLGDVAGPAR